MASNRAHHNSTKSDSTPSTRAAYGIEGKESNAVECSTSCGKSCVAGAVADGVAICCCCPFAVVNLVAFALLRVPWMLARRCIVMTKGKRKRGAECGGESRLTSGGMSCNYVERWIVNEGMTDVSTSFRCDLNDEVAEEEVWLELCRGFGRLSFTGVQSVGKGSLVNM